MPLSKLQFRPGVNRDQTNYSNEGGWFACDKIRFRSGYPEKIGGWVKSTPTPFAGVCRNMWNWVTTFSDNLLSLGTNAKLYIEAGGNYYDITPLRSVSPTLTTPSTDNCIQTSTTAPTTITVVIPAGHGTQTGNYVTISGVVGPVGGVAASQINGNHKVTVLSSSTFTFPITGPVTSNSAGGGGTAISISFEIDAGNPVPLNGYGWGTGTWGRSGWGLGSTSPVSQPQRDWWMDNFDNDLVANIRNGAPYIWQRGSTVDPGAALSTRAITLQAYATANSYVANDVPVKVMQLLVSQQDKHLIAFGAVPFGSTNANDFDPMLIRWASQDAPGNWTPTVTNTAGDLRISRGSRIVRALPTRQEILVWTDSHLYTLQFLGTTDVFGLQEYADNISIASPRAVATASNITYWMGQDKFYAYTGRVETLPCTLRNHVFQNLNFAQAEQIISGTNEQWNEVWWFYPTADSEVNNAYVVYNHLDRLWYYGSIDRTAWLDTALRRYPQAANTPVAVNNLGDVTVGNGYLYSHENGLDDDGAALSAYIESSDFDLGEGDQFMLTRRMLPDVNFDDSTANTPEVTLEVRTRNFPGSSLSNNPSDAKLVMRTTVDTYTEQVFVRARARQMALKVISDQLGVQWQLGAPRLDMREDGRR
jgi:hypothetical protein